MLFPSLVLLYTLGNHEFYRQKYPGLIDKLKMGAEGWNVNVLENESVEIGGYRFLGSKTKKVEPVLTLPFL